MGIFLQIAFLRKDAHTKLYTNEEQLDEQKIQADPLQALYGAEMGW